jgi:hypothetical protein
VQVINLCPVLSVNQISEELSVSVFPNPGNGKFTLTLSSEKGTVEIYNLLGKQVYHSEIINQNAEIDLSGEPKGIYVAKLYAGRKVLTEKIIIR